MIANPTTPIFGIRWWRTDKVYAVNEIKSVGLKYWIEKFLTDHQFLDMPEVTGCAFLVKVIKRGMDGTKRNNVRLLEKAN